LNGEVRIASKTEPRPLNVEAPENAEQRDGEGFFVHTVDTQVLWRSAAGEVGNEDDAARGVAATGGECRLADQVSPGTRPQALAVAERANFRRTLD
jgi:hypothetical protein